MGKEKKAKVRIIFKGGAIQDVECTSFELRNNSLTNQISKLEWADMSPNSLYISLDDISAIFEILE